MSMIPGRDGSKVDTRFLEADRLGSCLTGEMSLPAGQYTTQTSDRKQCPQHLPLNHIQIMVKLGLVATEGFWEGREATWG